MLGIPVSVERILPLPRNLTDTEWGLLVADVRDTFKARKNARKLGCNWSSYSSSCKCGAWVQHRRSTFVDYALTLFP